MSFDQRKAIHRQRICAINRERDALAHVCKSTTLFVLIISSSISFYATKLIVISDLTDLVGISAMVSIVVARLCICTRWPSQKQKKIENQHDVEIMNM